MNQHGACRFAEESDAAFGTSVLPMGIHPTICDVLASLVDGFREEVVGKDTGRSWQDALKPSHDLIFPVGMSYSHFMIVLPSSSLFSSP